MLKFEELIAPVSIEQFFSENWEKSPLHNTSNDPRRFESLFSYRDIERWVHSTRHGFFFVLHPDGDTVRIQSHQADAVAPGVVSTHFKNGLAQIMKRVNDWPSLQDFVGHLKASFLAQVEVNIFWTPPGARSHPTYTCNDNIFVLQLEGEEVWELRELTVVQLDLPEKEHLEFSEPWINRHEHPVVEEVRLRPGDMLYVPRGMPHRALSPENGMGLHLRVYVNTLTWVDFFKMAVERAAIDSQDLRRSLPYGFVEDDTLRNSMESHFRQLMSTFQETPFNDVLSVARRNRVAHQGFPSSEVSGHLTEPNELTLNSEVERKAGVLCTVEDVLDGSGNPKSSIFFGGHQVNGPPGLRRGFEFIRDQARFRISEIPGLDEKSQLVLARRLVGEGLLRPADGEA